MLPVAPSVGGLKEVIYGVDEAKEASTSVGEANEATRRVAIAKVEGPALRSSIDCLAVEEPLEIRLAFTNGGRPMQQSLAITMRTPGDDIALACGYLLAEGLLRTPDEVANARPCGPPAPGGGHNVVRIELRPGVAVDLQRLERRGYMTSSCGVCGKASLEALQVAGLRPLAAAERLVPAALIHRLPGQLRQAQRVFAATGGLHAAGLFDAAGQLCVAKEDVGRHNAVDKVIGTAYLEGLLPLTHSMLMVSGRASFELVQKALLAGIPLLAAVSAPSSLAVELASRYGMTLLGFVRGERFNVYCGGERLSGLAAVPGP